MTRNVQSTTGRWALRLAPIAFAIFLTAYIGAVAIAEPQAVADSAHHDEVLDLLGLRKIARLEQGLTVTLRDGTRLFGSALIPLEVAQDFKRPTILVQSPYPLKTEAGWWLPVLTGLLREGYVVAFVSVRGTQWSEGHYRWTMNQASDGFDTVEWVSKQPWSNGRVGTFGCSSSGEVELPTAKSRPPSLKAFVAMSAVTSVGDIPGFDDKGIFFSGGVPATGWAMWYRGDGFLNHPQLPHDISVSERLALMRTFDPASADMMTMESDLKVASSWMSHLPSQGILQAVKAPESEWNRMITMPPEDPRWAEYDFLRDGDTVDAAGLHISSWYDLSVFGSIKAYEYLKSKNPNQYLMVDPGRHCLQFSPKENLTLRDEPVDVSAVTADAIIKFFNHWVKQDGEGRLDLPRARYLPIQGAEWQTSNTWPVRSRRRDLYLASQGNAAGPESGGTLSFSKGVKGSEADRFSSDPMNPVPSHGGGIIGLVVDQREIEKRPDVLVYTTEPFTRGLKIAGDVVATLFVSSTARDTDIAIKLVDVHPDGSAYNIVETIKRLRYRDGFREQKLMQPGTVYKVALSNMVTAANLGPGHRLRVEVAGSNFSRYERNLNTGGRNFDETTPVVANNMIFHSGKYPSHISIPVVD